MDNIETRNASLEECRVANKRKTVFRQIVRSEGIFAGGIVRGKKALAGKR